MPERGRHAGPLHREGAARAAASTASAARSSSPTTAAPTGRRRSHGGWARGSSTCSAKGYGNALRWAASRPRAARSSSWAMPTTATTFSSCRSSSTSCAKGTTWCRAAGFRPAAARSARRDAAPAPLVGQPDVLARWCARMFWAPVHDVYCGLRGFRKDLFDRLDLRCSGMEFATEMIIKSSLQQRAHRRGADHAPPGRPQGARAAPEDVSRRLADAAVLPDVQPALAVPVSGGCCCVVLGALGYALALPGLRIGRHSLRRAHAAVREPGDPARLPVHRLRDLREDRRDGGRSAAAQPAHGRLLPVRHAGARSRRGRR